MKAGAGRIVYTSYMGASPSSHFVAMRDHAATEELLQASGVPFTSLHNGFYATTVRQFMGPALQTGTIELPEDGPVSWTTHADLAEAAAVVLTDEGRFDGLTPPLTAAEAVDFDRVAAIARADGEDDHEGNGQRRRLPREHGGPRPARVGD